MTHATPDSIAAALRSDITRLLVDAANDLVTAKGNLDLFLNERVGHLTGGRALELAEDVLDHCYSAYELALKAAALEEVVAKIEGKP